MSLKSMFCVTLSVILVLASGCGKKKPKQKTDSGLAEAPAVSRQQEDTGDVFEEFYEKEDTMKAEKVEKTTGFDDEFVSSKTTSEFVRGGRYVVQVTCVASRSFAEKIKADCEARGWPAYIAVVDNPTADLIGTYYRVRIDGFNYVTPAREFGVTEVEPAGYNFWIDNRSNDNVGMSGYGLGESDMGEYSSSEPSSSTPAQQTQTWESAQDEQQIPSSSPEPVYEEAAMEEEAVEKQPASETTAEPAEIEPESELAPTDKAADTAEPAPVKKPEQKTGQEMKPKKQKPAPADDWGEDEWGEDEWGEDSEW